MWILIIMVNYTGITYSVEFTSQATCISAEKKVKDLRDNMNTVCVQK